MKKIIRKVNAYLKGLVLISRPHLFLGWLRHPFLSIANILSLTAWISRQQDKTILNDFYSAKRDYAKRYKLYAYLLDSCQLKEASIDYLEFGVCKAHSFNWWIKNNIHPDSRFYGFDTFEGLPENWGTFNQGEMVANIPTLDDKRGTFIKGLFQDTVGDFLIQHNLRNGKRKIIHLDADLFSSTLYALTCLAPYLKKGDILIFDEFNVPNHEYYAFKLFCDSYYVKTKLLGAVNNYFQAAFVIE